jgi:DNA-binding winged helix-turn-helix (wHTH) protein
MESGGLPELHESARTCRLRFGVFELDARSGELRRDGAVVRLPPQPFKVLWLLASRSGEVVTREEIRQELWGQDTFVDFDGGLNFCINQIRKALRDSAESPRFVHTLPRRGYRFIATVEALPASDRSPAATPPNGIHAEAPPLEIQEEVPALAAGLGRGAARVLVSPRFTGAAPRPVALREDDSAERPALPTALAGLPVRRRPSRGLVFGLLAVMTVAAAVTLARRVHVRPGEPAYQRLTFRRGSISAARFGLDGQVLYSAAWDGAPNEIFTMRPGTVDSRALGVKPAALMAALPSGDIGVMLLREKAPSVLARAPIGGGAPRELRDKVRDAAWHAEDLAAVVVRRGTEDHLEFPPGRDVYHAPARLANVRVSPDGQRVAFLEQPVPGDDRGSVVSVDREGRRTELTGGWASLEGLAWSADGREVWFTGTRVGADSHLNAVTLDGTLRLLARGPGRMVLHDVDTAGRALVERNIRRFEVKGQFPSGDPDRDLSWLDYSMVTGLSPDGSAVVISESGEGGGPGYSVFLRPTDGAPPVRLGEGRAMTPSPDGRFVLSIPLTGAPRVLALPTAAGETRVLGEGLVGHAVANWFPDSRRIVFAASQPERPIRIWVQDVEGGGRAAPITPEGIAAWRPSVSADGKWVLARAAGQEGPWMEYPVGGGAPRAVPNLRTDDRVLTWSDDGRYLYVAPSGPTTLIERIEPATGGREKWREIRPSDPSGTSKILIFHLTPDAKYFAYTVERSFSELYLLDGLR